MDSKLIQVWQVRFLQPKGNKNLEATVSGGIGYTGDGFGVGVGYNYTYNNAAGGNVDAHTPVFVFNAVNNNWGCPR